MVVSRRTFLKNSAVAATGFSLLSSVGFAESASKLSWIEARYYTKLENDRVRCELCPWHCVVAPGKRGHCDVRANRDGVYYSLVYGRIASYHNDPIEKKPFFHFHPASQALSVATAGCNVDCKFCQNWELAQRKPEDLPSYPLTTHEMVSLAKRWNSKSIAFTYNEPTVFAEYIHDIAETARQSGIYSVVVSNGFINKKPLLDLCSVVDAYKIDLKAYTESYYRDVVGGRLAPVLETLVTLKEQGIWFEIVYLMVPTLNDNTTDISKMVKWIIQELGPDVPLHFSRFYPKYKLTNLPPTPVKTLETARKIAMDGGLHFVYMGNVPGHEGENTYCPNCGKTLIRRLGYQIYENHIQKGCCAYCRHPIAGVWDD